MKTALTAFQDHHPHALIRKIVASIPSGFRTEPVLVAIRNNLAPRQFAGFEFCPGRVNHTDVLLGFTLDDRGQVEILQVWRHYTNVWNILNMAQIDELESVCKAFKTSQNAATTCDATSAAESLYEVSL